MNKNNYVEKRTLLYVVMLMLTLSFIVVPVVVHADHHTVNLGTASTFGVLAGSTITNTGPTTINGTAGGDIGLHPGDDPSILTFPGQEQVSLTGTIHLFDAVAQQAKADLLIAYNDAAGRTSDETISADLGGRTLTAGVYTSASSLGLTGTLTLDGENNPSAVFIFQAGSTLTTASNSEVILINNAQACNVFWQVGSSATLGTGTNFVGQIFASASITATTGVEVDGQLLALNGAVTMDTNVITNDACQSAGSLRVTKVVEGDTGSMILPNFEITVTGPNNYSDTQTIESGGSYTWPNLISGTYTVVESGLGEGWSTNGTGEYKVQIGQRTDVTITNTYSPDDVMDHGSLTVVNVVTGDVGGMTLPNFSITISGPEGYTSTRLFAEGESFTWDHLETGTYTITESRVGLSGEWTVSGEGSVIVVADQTVSRTITNTYGVIPLPNTGVSSSWMSYVALILLGLGSFILRKWK
ncbi:MAG: ice-binding family protein [Erysipelotrichaceae bacterium]|nr:ice-binding family protein [Erysipelotrichaceae bacterium]